MNTVFVLIIMVTSGNPDRVVTQEFETKQACERASQIVKITLNNADVACVPKF